MLKKVFTIFLFIFLTNCSPTGTALLGPLFTGAKTGSAYQASLSFGTGHLLKKANSSSKKSGEISYPQEEFLIKKHY